MSKNKINVDKVNGAIQQSFDETLEILSTYLDQAIIEDDWDWPRETHRANGDIATSPRDIVDTGELLDSKLISRSSDGFSVEYSWEVDYALPVHEGATTVSGLELPARPWTQKALEQCNLLEIFAEKMTRNL